MCDKFSEKFEFRHIIRVCYRNLFVLGYPQTSYDSTTGGTTVIQKLLNIAPKEYEINEFFLVIQVTYSAGNSITYYPNGSRTITYNGVAYNYDSNGMFSVDFCSLIVSSILKSYSLCFIIIGNLDSMSQGSGDSGSGRSN